MALLKSLLFWAAVTLAVSLPASDARLRHGSSTGSLFNNGLTEAQSTVPSLSSDFPFINLLRSNGNGWLGNDTSNAGGYIQPDGLDAFGYPSASLFPNSGIYAEVTLPNGNSQPATAGNPFVVTWEGNSTMGVFNNALTFVNGTTNSTAATFDVASGLYKGRMEFYPTYDASGNASFQMFVRSIVGGAYVRNINLFFKSDESSLLAGEIFAPKYKSVLQTMGPGVIRFMDWFYTNASTITTWGTQKTFNYPFWSDYEFRPGMYAGDTTNSGNNYSLSNGSFALADRLTFHLHFNASSTLNVNTTSGFGRTGSPQTLTVALTPQITFTWASHPFSNGDPVGLLVNGNAPAGTTSYTNYFVVNKTLNTFQIATSAGGTALSPANLGSAAVGIEGLPTLALNGGAAMPIKAMGMQPLGAALAPTTGGTTRAYGTVVYDSYFQTWLLSGGNSASANAGLQNGIPIEAMLQLCKEIGAHPHFSIPYLALDPPTNFTTQLATYVKASGSSWMIPRYEPGNEMFNNLTPLAQYAAAKTAAYWGTSFFWADWTGMVLSTMGQDVAGVYGIGNLGTTYEVLAPVQTIMTYPQTGLFDPILTSARYVAVGPTFAGYTRSAASGWASAVLPSTYITPADYGSIAEHQLAYDYYYTSSGNPTQQAADLNTYIDSLQAASSTPLSVTGAANNGSGAVRLAVSSTSSFASGDTAYVTGVGGTTEANGIWTVDVMDGTHLDLRASTFTHAWTSGGTAYRAGLVTLEYAANVWHGTHQWAAGFGVNKMFGYEGGYSPDYTPGYKDAVSPWVSSNFSNPSATLPVRGVTTQITLDTTTSTYGNSGYGGNQIAFSGNPAAVGMLVAFPTGTGFPFILNNSTANSGISASFSNVSLDVTWTAHNLHANEVVLFSGNNLPSNVTAGTYYYALSTNLTTNTFRFAATKGGTAIQPNTTTTGAALSAYVVTAVSGNVVTFDCDSSGAVAPTASMQAVYPNSLTYINNFRAATQKSGTHMQARITDALTYFQTYGGTFFAQYEIAGSGAIWPLLQPDIWATQGGEYLAYKAWNGH